MPSHDPRNVPGNMHCRNYLPCKRGQSSGRKNKIRGNNTVNGIGGLDNPPINNFNSILFATTPFMLANKRWRYAPEQGDQR